MVNENNKKSQLQASIVFQILIFCGIITVFLYATDNALAAPLNYTSDTSVALTDPAITLTILANSTADSFTAASGSFTLVVSGGQEFTLTSASRDLSVSGDSTGGNLYPSCNGARVKRFNVISDTGTQTLVVTPTSEQCVSTVPAPLETKLSSGGTGWGGGSASTAVVVSQPTPTPVVAVDKIASTQSQLDALLSQLKALQAQQAQMQLQSPMPTFTSALARGSNSSEVKWLQQFLISQSKGSAAKKLESFGVNGNFGPMTEAALKEFQAASGISPVGVLGPKTKAYIQTLIQGQQPMQAVVVSLPDSKLDPMPTFTSALARGSNSSEVKWLQQFLISQSKGSAAKKLESFGANGNFGPMTEAALKEFQAASGISPVGVLGPKTKAYIQTLVK